MSKYKYKTELKNYDNESLATDKEESDFLNEHGELGWELVRNNECRKKKVIF